MTTAPGTTPPEPAARPHPGPRPLPAGQFTGPAAPYRGGDPYADHRAADHPFTALPDLADRRLGGTVLAAGDEYFAEREHLLTPGPARFDPDAYGPRGKIMDGWETRRRRGAAAGAPHPGGDEHDWALIRLGTPGTVHGVVVDTAHFRGNHPDSVRLEGTALDGAPGPAELLDPAVRWTALVPRTRIGGHAANGFATPAGTRRRLTHLRLCQYPDGGIARLRVHGEPLPDPAWLAALGGFDLAALEHGGRVQEASDRFFSPPGNTILPGRAHRMDDGWETRRRRDRGHDWIRYALAGHCLPRAVEIDTGCFRGNAPGWASVHVLDATRPGAGDPADHTAPGWTEILPPARLRPDTVHRFLLRAPAEATHARLTIHPDGGIARFRLHGSLTARGAARLAARHRALGGRPGG
ncbi:allantoicase [Streptomyces aidingensis]|uniref:Probable allantoicase n=1 Tax=Streptomyces aidingensis TaxID=910347 RepID=A0A1I1IVG3_9ACTN|nr:allantoicase [Streptomyces aidingensis]SFC39702.1 allantoicase [Streptomyces aidingensis]